MTRLSSSTFNLPVEKIRNGYYSDQYFNLTKELLEAKGKSPIVTVQVFQRKDSILGGVDEAIAILRECSGQYVDSPPTYYDGGTTPYIEKEWRNGWDQLEVKALHEGDNIKPWEPVLEIVGPYNLFAHLETVYLGTLARRSLVMNNVSKVVKAANGKPIFFFPARHDHWLVQTGDGWSAHVAGAIGVSTDANASWWGGVGMGTVPHGLIAAYSGDTVSAARDFADRYSDEMNITVLVDFDNDSVQTAVEVADALGDKLWGVRLDTSGTLVDENVQIHEEYGRFDPLGVNPQLVELVRTGLDENGHPDVNIVVSGGFTVEKIEKFEAANVPVDAYGVGSSLLRGSNDFTADVVKTDGFHSAKVGRWEQDSSRLEIVK